MKKMKKSKNDCAVQKAVEPHSVPIGGWNPPHPPFNDVDSKDNTNHSSNELNISLFWVILFVKDAFY